MISRDVMKSLLKEVVATVTFEKKDGTERIMKCTLMDSHLPPPEATWNKKKPCDSTLSVWDLDKEEWRSFRLTSVKDVNVSISNNMKENNDGAST